MQNFLKMKNNLAVVIPYFKIDFFKETINSLANQTDKNFNVYIGNDASATNPEKLIDTFREKVNITYRNFSENLGSKSLVLQWYRCLELVQHEEWVLFLCDDDVLDFNVVASFYEHLNEIEAEGSSVVRFASQVIDANGIKQSNIYKHPVKELGFDFLERKLKGGSRSSLSEYLFNKKELLKIGIKDLPLAWYSDLLLVIEMAIYNPIFTINQSIVFFRNSGINITSKNDNLVKKNEATFAFYFFIIENYDKRISSSFIEQIYFRLEKTILDNKKNINYWLKTFKLYLNKGKFTKFACIVLKALKSIT